MPPVGQSLMSMVEEDEGVVRGRTEVALAGEGHSLSTGNGNHGWRMT